MKKNDPVIDHASRPQIAQVLPNFHVFCPNDLEDVGQGHPFSIAMGRYLICIFCANLVKIHPLLFYLSCVQAQNAKKQHIFWPGDLDLWPWPLKMTHVPNLVNLGQTRLELSCGQKCYRQTDGRTDRQTDRRTDRRTDGTNDNTPRPNWPRGKNNCL